MTKKFKLDEVDCGYCASLMEDLIKKIPGVHDASVNFLTQKLTIDADDEGFDTIMENVQKACFKIDPDCKIVMA